MEIERFRSRARGSIDDAPAYQGAAEAVEFGALPSAPSDKPPRGRGRGARGRGARPQGGRA
jgi:hypothetical protein